LAESDLLDVLENILKDTSKQNKQLTYFLKKFLFYKIKNQMMKLNMVPLRILLVLWKFLTMKEKKI
jgi:hypothetical protein